MKPILLLFFLIALFLLFACNRVERITPAVEEPRRVATATPFTPLIQVSVVPTPWPTAKPTTAPKLGAQSALERAPYNHQVAVKHRF